MNNHETRAEAGAAATPAEHPLEAYGKEHPFDPNAGKANAAAAIANGAEKAAAGASDLFTRWQKYMAQKKANKLDEALQQRSADQSDAQAFYEETEQTLEGARSEKNSNNRIAEEARTDAKNATEQRDAAKQEQKFGKYVGRQAEQVGAILNAGGGVVKSALASFKAGIIIRIPKIKIEVTSAKKTAEADWNTTVSEDAAERREAKQEVNKAERAKNNLGKAVENFRTQVNGIKENKEDYANKKQAYADAKKELAEAIATQKRCEADAARAQKAYSEAEAARNKADEALRKASAEYGAAEQRKNEATEKVEAINDQIESAEKRNQIRAALGNRSPKSVKEGLEAEKAKAEKEVEDLSDRLLMMKAIYADHQDASLAARIGQIEDAISGYDIRINSYDEQIDLVDEYISGRQKTAEEVAPRAKKSIRSFTSSALSRAASFFL